jgi:glutathione S-transferase
MHLPELLFLLPRRISMIQIYGSPRTSAGRCFLMAEEVGAKYEILPLDMSKREHKSDSFLKLNPNGKVPCLIDGDFILWESLAITYYLAEKYKPELLGSSPEKKAKIQQWSLWALTELQPPLVDLIIQTMFTPEDKRDSNVIKKAHEAVPAKLAILEQALKGKNYIAGEMISSADFNLASVVNIAPAMKISLSEFANVVKWFNLMKERPSFKKFIDLRHY